MFFFSKLFALVAALFVVILAAINGSSERGAANQRKDVRDDIQQFTNSEINQSEYE